MKQIPAKVFGSFELTRNLGWPVSRAFLHFGILLVAIPES